METNNRAERENQENRSHVKFYKGHAEVDASKATYRGKRVSDLHPSERRKFENIVLLTNLDKAKNGLPNIKYR